MHRIGFTGGRKSMLIHCSIKQMEFNHFANIVFHTQYIHHLTISTQLSYFLYNATASSAVWFMLVHLWRYRGGYPALTECLDKLNNNKVRDWFIWTCKKMTRYAALFVHFKKQGDVEMQMVQFESISAGLIFIMFLENSSRIFTTNVN